MGRQSLRTRTKSAREEVMMKSNIVIDEARGLIFGSEDELYDHFVPQIQLLEKEYFTLRADIDLKEDQFGDYEELLQQVLDDPDEVWEDVTSIHGFTVRNYIGHYTANGESVYYIALAYVTAETPTFIYLHFPTNDMTLVERYRRGKLVHDRVMSEVAAGSVEGDALGEGDDLAVGLYRAMQKLRSEGDIAESTFKDYEEFRETTIEEPDEIWRSNDLSGNILVSFIKHFTESESDTSLSYVVVTIEDTPSSSHALLFSFPTKDDSLVDRYRHGENLQADEVVQEASH